jgi:hypothetical protein
LKKAKRGRLSKIDREAMQRAIDLVRAEGPERARWIDNRDFFEAGSLASYHCQYRALQLRPWEWPPSWIEPGDIEAILSKPPDHSGKRRAAELLHRLLAAGLSRWEPNPADALERAEKKPDAA